MLIDKKELMFFLGDLGPEVLPSLIDVYLSDSENTIQKITDAVASGDYVSLAREVHTLKGVGSTYGATRIRELAVELDGRFKKGEELSELKSEIMRLIEVIRATNVEMRQIQSDVLEGKPV
ncbi:Hpt domain-containing protein [Ruminobacter sp. RM87]|uniref:Hpt domain-containing protein n=1 Tax=Ruminobacter sp. RM87 TaxID=1200567 RepID=UPI0004E1F6EF|nr:Hpt domain-containing protein [Ruminobacter sp. RM87]